MCLTSKYKLKENFRFLKEGETFVLPKKTNTKQKNLFHKGEAYALA